MVNILFRRPSKVTEGKRRINLCNFILFGLSGNNPSVLSEKSVVNILFRRPFVKIRAIRGQKPMPDQGIPTEILSK